MILNELLSLTESVKMNEDGVYKHTSGMCEVHVDDSDPEDGVRARVMYKSVKHDDEDQIEISHKKYMKFVESVMSLYDLDVQDAATETEDEDGNTVIYLDFPPGDLE